MSGRQAIGTRSWLVVVMACSAIGNTLPAQSRPVVIAILPFEDRGSYGQDKEVFRALQLGIPATIAGELSGHSELRLADPARVTQSLQAQGADLTARLDAATAARVGKQAGARYAVTGTFADFYGKFRLDARIVDVETGQILKVVSNNDAKLQDRADLYRIIQAVGHKVLAEATSTWRDAQETTPRVIPTEALIQYSLGLLSESQGYTARAAQHYNQALSAFPYYSQAREGARRVQGR